jgi:hypothetical protein
MDKLSVKSFLIILLSGLLVSCENKSETINNKTNKANKAVVPKYRQLATDEELYEVINFCLTNDDLFAPDIKYLVDGNPIRWAGDEDSLDIAKIDTIFTKADKAYMLEQQRWAPDFRIKPEKRTRKFNMISADTLMERYLKKQDTADLFKGTRGAINAPLFSQNA